MMQPRKSFTLLDSFSYLLALLFFSFLLISLGSSDERIAFERAYAFGVKTPYHKGLDVIKDEGDITIDISTVGKAVNGQTLVISVKVKQFIE